MANEEKKAEYLQFTTKDGSASELFKIPHTWQDVGAAPGEFGLGEAAKQIVDWNSATKTGFYWSTGEAANRPFDWQAAWGYTIAANENESPDLTQVAFTYTGGSDSTMRDNFYQKVRYCKGTIGWSEWEWVNPPMALGVEYRTTERYLGKPVYTQLFQITGITDGKQESLLSASQVSHVIRYNGHLYNSRVLPFLSFNTNGTKAPYYTDAYIQRNDTNWYILFSCGTSITNSTALYQLWYVK